MTDGSRLGTFLRAVRYGPAGVGGMTEILALSLWWRLWAIMAAIMGSFVLAVWVGDDPSSVMIGWVAAFLATWAADAVEPDRSK